MASEYNAGMVGVVLAATVDRHVTSWDMTTTTKFTNTTTTEQYDPVAKDCWETSIPTTSSGSGSFKMNFDKNAPPYNDIYNGAVVAADFTAVIGRGFTGTIGIDSLAISNGGIENVVEATANFHLIGKPKWK